MEQQPYFNLRTKLIWTGHHTFILEYPAFKLKDMKKSLKEKCLTRTYKKTRHMT